jgi:flagellar biosynthesis anti-sigma factor FlgM
VQKQLQAIPDVRVDKVAELRAQIENGSYEIKPDAIAGKMIRESLLNDLLK